MMTFLIPLVLAAAQAGQAIQISTDAVTVEEGSTATFTVQLAMDPGGTVDVAVTNTIGLTSVTASPNPLVFNSANWSTAQTVTVSAPVDGDTVDNGATLTLSAPGLASVRVVVTAVDTVPIEPNRPVVRISLPRNGDTVSGTRAEFFGSGTPAAGSANAQGQFFIDGILVYTDPGPGHYHVNGGHTAWDTTLLTDGPHVLRLSVTDDAVPARTGTHEVTVVVANGTSGGGGGGGSGSGSCGANGLETLILFPLLRAFRRRRWRS